MCSQGCASSLAAACPAGHRAWSTPPTWTGVPGLGRAAACALPAGTRRPPVEHGGAAPAGRALRSRWRLQSRPGPSGGAGAPVSSVGRAAGAAMNDAARARCDACAGDRPLADPVPAGQLPDLLAHPLLVGPGRVRAAPVQPAVAGTSSGWCSSSQPKNHSRAPGRSGAGRWGVTEDAPACARLGARRQPAGRGVGQETARTGPISTAHGHDRGRQ